MLATEFERKPDDDKKHARAFAAARDGWLRLIAGYPNLSGADVAVAVMLAIYMNSKSREAWPSLTTLAADTNRDRSTVYRSLKRLEKMQLLRIVHGTRGKSNRYRPLFGRLDVNLKALKRTTGRSPRWLRTRNHVVANSQ